MKNDYTTRCCFYALISLFFYIACCYIGFSEPWSVGIMKIFMAGILASGVLFVFFCGKCANAAEKSQKNGTQHFTLAHSQC